MLLYIVGYAAVLSALYAFGFWGDADWLRYDQASAWRLALVLIALPTAVSWAAAEGLHALSPRRLFDHRVRGRLRRPVLGVISALLAATAAAFLLPLIDGFVSDAVVMAGCAAAFTVIPLVLQSRLKPGRCIHCGYDLRTLTSHARGRCPECGAVGSVYARGGGGRPAISPLPRERTTTACR